MDFFWDFVMGFSQCFKDPSKDVSSIFAKESMMNTSINFHKKSFSDFFRNTYKNFQEFLQRLVQKHIQRFSKESCYGLLMNLQVFLYTYF